MHLYFFLLSYQVDYILHNNRLYHNYHVLRVMVVMAIELVFVLSFYTLPLLLFREAGQPDSLGNSLSSLVFLIEVYSVFLIC